MALSVCVLVLQGDSGKCVQCVEREKECVCVCLCSDVRKRDKEDYEGTIKIGPGF